LGVAQIPNNILTAKSGNNPAFQKDLTRMSRNQAGVHRLVDLFTHDLILEMPSCDQSGYPPQNPATRRASGV
jgi:hypothetical protein